MCAYAVFDVVPNPEPTLGRLVLERDGEEPQDKMLKQDLQHASERGHLMLDDPHTQGVPDLVGLAPWRILGQS